MTYITVQLYWIAPINFIRPEIIISINIHITIKKRITSGGKNLLNKL